MANQRISYTVASFLFCASIIFLAYGVVRTDTLALFITYFTAFAVYGWIFLRAKEESVKFWLLIAFAVRISLLVAMPTLSDDFYRFIWDGRLLVAGEHPFSALPSDFLSRQLPDVDEALFQKLNSPSYFTIYPPVAQGFFWLSAVLSPSSVLGSVVVMRVLLIAAEAGSVLLMISLLKKFQLPTKNVLLYALNPLAIIELTGNLHFEGFMIFFLLLTVQQLASAKNVGAALSFALAVGVKLLPLIFLPLMLPLLGWRKAIGFWIMTCVAICLLFLPMYDAQVVAGFSESLNLYFQKFEFNASVYYLVREYGFWKYGYNTIQTSGWKLGVVCGILIVMYSFFIGYGALRNSSKPWTVMLTCWMFILLIYFLFTTILHPWYITTLLAFSVFTRFRFAMLWTALIFLTYAGYSIVGFHENHVLLVIEYVAVIGYLAYELWQRDTSSA